MTSEGELVENFLQKKTAVVNYGGDSLTDFELVIEALKARKKAYAPYSHHGVGAALLCKDGSVISGCNIENAAYGPSNCAERTAIFKAVSEGEYSFEKIAIVGGMDDQLQLDFCPPCGVCRQVMMEFVNPKRFLIVLAKVHFQDDIELISEKDVEIKSLTLEELLPLGFGPDNVRG